MLLAHATPPKVTCKIVWQKAANSAPMALASHRERGDGKRM